MRRLPPVRRLLLVPLTLLALVACSAAPPPGGPVGAPSGDDPASAPPDTSPTVAERKVMVGAYLDLKGMSKTQAQALRSRQLGRDLRIVHVFYAWEDPLPDRLPTVPVDSTALLSWRGTHYADITSGASDEKLTTDARALARYGRPIMLRWGWEMNGDWYKWCGVNNDRNPDGYIAAWRRMHQIFTAAGATNVSWVWSPNHNSRPTDDWNTRARYYPGDEYVDWVGVSGYNFRRETPEDLFGPIYREFADRKPLMLAEVGAVDRGGRTKPDWITSLGEWITAHPRVGAIVWFDTDTHPGSAQNWRVDSSPDALDAYRTMVTGTRFDG